MNIAEAILVMMVDSIKNFDNDKLILGFDSIDLLGMERKYADELFWLLMFVSRQYGNRNAVIIILEQWNQVLPPETYAEIYSYIFTFQNLDSTILRFITDSVQDVSLLEICDDLLHIDRSSHVVLSLNKAYEVFGEQPENTWRALAEIAMSKDNYYAYDYFRFRQAKVSRYSKTPLWVSTYPELFCSNEASENRNKVKNTLKDIMEKGNLKQSDLSHIESIRKKLERIENICDKDKLGIGKDDLPYSSDIVLPKVVFTGKNPKTIHEINDMVRESSVLLGYTDVKISEIETRLLHELHGLPKRELVSWTKSFIIDHHLLELQWDPNFFRVYGPSHPYIGTTMMNQRLGGERMFHSNDYDHTDDDEKIDWFTGYCESCFHRIRRRWHSVRKPMPIGGWKGNFCSWNCCRESVNDEENICYKYIDFFEKQMNRIGIQDRLDDEDIAVYQMDDFDNLSRDISFNMSPDVTDLGRCSISTNLGSAKSEVKTTCKIKGCEVVQDNISLFKLLADYYSHELESDKILPRFEDEIIEDSSTIRKRLVSRCKRSGENDVEEKVCE